AAVALAAITVATSFTSLRASGGMEWRIFVERQSAADAVLRQEPVGAFGRGTFATRDAYRHVIERIAKRTGRAEATVAEFALSLARAAGSDPRRSHVGYYLVDAGRDELE